MSVYGPVADPLIRRLWSLWTHDRLACCRDAVEEIERLSGNVAALRAVIHLAWIDTYEGTTPMPGNVRAAIGRALHDEQKAADGT